MERALAPRGIRKEDRPMSANSKKSLTSTFILILLGTATLLGGAKWLVILIPAALIVWYAARPVLRSGRN